MSLRLLIINILFKKTNRLIDYIAHLDYKINKEMIWTFPFLSTLNENLMLNSISCLWFQQLIFSFCLAFQISILIHGIGCLSLYYMEIASILSGISEWMGQNLIQPKPIRWTKVKKEKKTCRIAYQWYISQRNYIFRFHLDY